MTGFPLRDRLWEIEALISACETVIKSDHPDWTRDHLSASKPFVHKIPVKLGSATKQAMDVLRLADEPMTVKEIAIEVLRREGQQNPTTETITKVANTGGNGLRKTPLGEYIDNDGGWPARWWADTAKFVDKNGKAPSELPTTRAGDAEVSKNGMPPFATKKQK